MDKAATGKKGEDLAAEYLSAGGYQILDRNYRYRRSEIDIIACKEGILVFCEVKAKTSVAFGNPEDAVDNRKAAKIIEGADQYIYDQQWQGDIRFDVISVHLTKGQPPVIHHFIDAFY